MKTKIIFLVLSACFLFGACQSDPNTLTVKGTITGFDEGMPVYLFAPRVDGRGYFVADSARIPANGRFALEAPAKNTEIYYITMGDLGKTSPYYKYFYGAPGKTNRITGEHFAPQSWRVKSNIPEQKEWNRFWKATYSLTYELETLTVELNRIDHALKTGTPEEKAALVAQADSLRRIETGIRQEIDRIELNTILENPHSDRALDKLANLAARMGEDDYLMEARDDIERAFLMLPAKIQESASGETIYNALYYPLARQGKPMPDGELIAPDGQSIKLSDFKGKYILLYFWDTSCDYCLKTLPEMKQFADENKNDLSVIQINTDDTPEYWKETAEKYAITGINLFAGIRHQIVRQYGVTIAPYFVLISPEGIVLEMDWQCPINALSEEFQKYQNP